MATQKPLIRYVDTGQVEELRAGDTVTGASSGTQRSFAFFMS
jgi:hypothetical protein